MKKVTVCTIFWHRARRYTDVLQSWMNQEEVNQVLVWDNSGELKTDVEGVHVISSSENINSRWRTLLAHLAKNDLVILAGDDFIAHKGLVKDLLKHWDEDKLIGIMGKNFTGDTYYTATGLRSHSTDKPVEMDYICTNVCLIHRKHAIDIDLREIPSVFIDDWWWEQKLMKKGVTLWVVPTNKWSEIPEGKDSVSHHLDPRLKELRELYFRKWIKKENIDPWDLYKNYLLKTGQKQAKGDNYVKT